MPAARGQISRKARLQAASEDYCEREVDELDLQGGGQRCSSSVCYRASRGP
jgi:hypothetical protein